MILKLFLCFLIHLTSISSRTIFPLIERNENDDCLSHNGLEGKCILITSCPAMQRCLHQQEHRPTICSWDRHYPIVCCPLVSPRASREESTELTTQKSISIPLKEKVNCGIKPPRVSIYVVGGDEVKSANDWPWMAALFTKVGSNFNHFCGGTIIHESSILTAAHCVHHLKNQVNTLYAGIGSNDLERTVKLSIQKIIIHPNYIDSKSYFDIALLITSTPIAFNDKIIPICLPDSNLNNLTDGFNQDDSNNKITVEVAGWGRQAYAGRTVDRLRAAQLEIIPHGQCNKSYSGLNNPSIPEGIKTDQLCAGTKNGEKDSCQGDSGGPLTLQAPSDDKFGGDVFYQIGVISFGRRCAVKEFPGVYTKISDYVPWIEKQLKTRKGRVIFE